MIDEFAKEYLHGDLRDAREALVWKLEGLSEYDVRRPLTATGTSLLGMVKHVAYSTARYFGEVFERPFPDTVPRWDDAAAWTDELWAAEHETRDHVLDLYQRVWTHADATVTTLPIDAPGFVPWWPRPHVKLLNIMVHSLGEVSRHAGHADILREQLDGSVGVGSWAEPPSESDRAARQERYATIERAARAAAGTQQPG